jgi:hypothetical protein
VARLLEAGYPEDSIHVIAPCPDDVHAEHVHASAPPAKRTPKAIAAGGGIGALLGGATAAVGFLTPAGPAVWVAGPLLAGLATGGVTGGLVGAMTARGVAPDVADYYDRAVRKGRTLVAVHGDAEAPALEKADEILSAAGAEPVELPR